MEFCTDLFRVLKVCLILNMQKTGKNTFVHTEMTQPGVESLDSGRKDFGLVLNLQFISLVNLEQVIYLLGVLVSPLTNSRKILSSSL